jgi:competence protein ComEC
MEGLKQLWQKTPLLWQLIGPVVFVTLVAIAFLQGRPDGRLHLYFLDVGQGNAILVLTPSLRTVLIDGGSDPTALLSALGRRLPFWQRELDMVLLTETESERMIGPVSALERYRPRGAGRPVRIWPSTGWDRWQALLIERGIEVVPLDRGTRLDSGDGVVIEVLHPGAEPLPGIVPGGRDDAVVLQLRYGGFSALLPTAAGPVVQKALLESDPSLSSMVLLVPRQAEYKALDLRFLRAVGPVIAVVSTGSGYHRGPDARTLRLIREAGVVVYRTDQQGTVECVTNGEWVDIRVQR